MSSMMTDLGLILVIAGVVTILFKRLGQPVVLGYIVAGFLCGPHMALFPSVKSVDNVEVWGNIGVVILMFTLGLEFSFKKIMKMGGSPFIAALTIIFCMIGLGSMAGHWFGWSKMNSLFLGGMLAMSSTTIIFKALNDLGLRQQRFANSVLSVLVVEDILGILLMVILAGMAQMGKLEGMALMGSLLKLGLVLVVWFVVGVFMIPTFLRRNRRWMGKETLLVVSLGLCFGMVWIAQQMEYSAAFGAFMMGSILAETVEAEQIGEIVSPVKDLFGAIFFVSVGMLVDPQVLAEYWLPIVVLVVLIIVGQMLFGTMGYLLSGQPLKVAMQCGFSMAQIGEFAFIIASLGESLKVTAGFLYPVVVAVSVITTFLTPYMIKLAVPAYNKLEPCLPTRLKETLNDSSGVQDIGDSKVWKRVLAALTKQVISYGFLTVAVVAVMLSSVLPVFTKMMGVGIGKIVCGILTILLISPFLRAIVMRKNHSDDFKYLWYKNTFNKFPLLFSILVRFVLSSTFIFYVLGDLTHLSTVVRWFAACGVMIVLMASKGVKRGSIKLEHLFFRNLHSREKQAAMKGEEKPQYASTLLSKDVHLSILRLPMNSRLAGMTLRSLDLAHKEGVMVAAVIREGMRVNIPGPEVTLYPGDKLQVIGNDDKLSAFAHKIEAEIYTDDDFSDAHEMILSRISVEETAPFVGKTVKDSRLREEYQCMVVGFEEESEQLGLPQALRVIKENDVVWLVGERVSLIRLMNNNKKTKE